MTLLRAFPPVARPDARVLVLGSMPGEASLAAARYYAYPQNRFWPFMGALVGADPALPYEDRLSRLTGAGIALWDALDACVRPGSLDSAIRDPRRNDFDTFLATHPDIRTILFNGAKAEAEFLRGGLPKRAESLALRRLPSTSPANASQPVETKLAAWRDAFVAAGVSVRPV